MTALHYAKPAFLHNPLFPDGNQIKNSEVQWDSKPRLALQLCQ